MWHREGQSGSHQVGVAAHRSESLEVVSHMTHFTSALAILRSQDELAGCPLFSSSEHYFAQRQILVFHTSMKYQYLFSTALKL